MDREVSDEEVQKLIHQKRLHICKYYYNCNVETYGQLGEALLQDYAFAKTYENKRKGLAKFISAAIEYYTKVNLEKN